MWLVAMHKQSRLLRSTPKPRVTEDDWNLARNVRPLAHSISPSGDGRAGASCGAMESFAPARTWFSWAIVVWRTDTSSEMLIDIAWQDVTSPARPHNVRRLTGE